MLHTWTDNDGITWTIEWRPATAGAQRVGGGTEIQPPGLIFMCTALVFHVPMPHIVDPRAMPPHRLQQMVDQAFE